jgi:para-aminobenzoate synthetase component 1
VKRKRIKLGSDFTELLEKLGPAAANPCLLSNNGNNDGWKSRLAWNPCDSYVLDRGKMINGKLYDFLAKHQQKQHLIVGFLSYDLGSLIYGVKSQKNDNASLPNAVFFAYDNYLEESGEDTCAYYKNLGFIDEVHNLKNQTSDKMAPKPKFKLLWDRESYKKAFKKVKAYIFDGVVYQINLTQNLEALYNGNPRTLFGSLHTLNEAKMTAYLEGDGFEILSMSPERFVRIRQGIIETTPIKGTRPRGADKEADDENERNLINDKKEKAELNMITDLLRNDLGKVCQAGSVKVVENRRIEKLPAIMHSYSRVRGKLKTGLSPFRALVSMIPGGSITGCPKKKAIEIISELEPTARQAYCGNIIVLDKNEELDSSILIRTVVKQGGRLSLSVGSGVVYDSNEQKEYLENLDKARSVIGNPS